VILIKEPIYSDFEASSFRWFSATSVLMRNMMNAWANLACLIANVKYVNLRNKTITCFLNKNKKQSL